MEVLIVLIPLALLLGGLFIAACLWAILGGQYDDLDTPAQRILMEDLEMKRKNNDLESMKESNDDEVRCK